MAYLVDTDIIIYSLKGHQGVRDWMIATQKIPKFISVITYGELLYGARKSDFPEKNIATARHIAEIFRVLEINEPVIEIFGDIKAKLEHSGNRLDDMDLLIASTSLYMNLSLVTNNKNHFDRIDGLILESWENIKVPDTNPSTSNT